MSADDRELELAETFAEVARVLLAEDDVDCTLERICSLAVETVEGCEFVGISLVQGRKVVARFTTNDVPRIVDELQSETGEGPCLDAIREHESFLTGALSQEQRWPAFAPRAVADTGVESVSSHRLFAAENTMGSLNLYSTQQDAFDEHAHAVGAVFAAHAAVAMSTARREEQLESKAAGRDVIGVAKGMIAARESTTSEEAFEILARASQRMNVKLREVAERLARGDSVATGRAHDAAGDVATEA